MRTIFGNIIAIYRRELQSYFVSPLSYLIAGIFWLLGGFFLISILVGPQGIISQVAALDQLGTQSPAVDVPYEFLKIYLNVLGSLSLFILPILSMGLYAEERKQGTLELLATSPVTNWVVAVGKLLGVVTFYGTLLLPLILCETIALGASEPAIQWVVPLVGHGGLLLLAASILSLGMFVSALTESTVLAAFMAFALVMFLWVLDAIANGLPGFLGESVKHLSLLNHYNNLVQGILDTSSLILFTSYIVLGIFLTAQFIEALRFQRS